MFQRDMSFQKVRRGLLPYLTALSADKSFFNTIAHEYCKEDIPAKKCTAQESSKVINL